MKKKIGIYKIVFITTNGDRTFDFGGVVEFKNTPNVVIKDGKNIKVIELNLI